MPVPDLIIRGQTVVLPDKSGPSAIHISGGSIVAVTEFDDVVAGSPLIEAAADEVIMPGLVDTHVHVNSPGRTEWEGFPTATRAAAAGGTTTIVDMPLNSIPPTTTLNNLNAKLAVAANNCFVDVGFWAGVVPGNTKDLEGLAAAGVAGFKCFLVPSGVAEFEHVTEANLREAMPELTRLNSLLIVHAELPGPIDDAPTGGPPELYDSFLRSRPHAAEDDAIALMIKLSKEFNTRVHIVHLSSADALTPLREARSHGVSISAETCPHYLFFSAEEIPDGATQFKCCPPIRENDNREQLWRAVADGTIETIVSDHSPCPGEMKLPQSGDFLKAWGGIASLQFRLPIVWTEGRRRGFDLSRITEWLCTNPAKQVGFAKKGSIAPGMDADLVLWAPDEDFEVREEQIEHRHKVTPYYRQKLKGVVKQTFLRGRKVYDGGEIAGPFGVALRLCGKN
jgi:allantoinase